MTRGGEIGIGVLVVSLAGLLACGIAWASHVARRVIDRALAQANDGRSEDGEV